MRLGLGISLTRSRYPGGLDADAAAYIAAVESALSSSISGDQKNAINTFFKTGKSAGWYSSLKRLYLPIWADAAANAIDMVTRTSGTFPVPGGVDNSNVGYIQGDGSTGYFNTGLNPSTAGLTNGSAWVGALWYDVVTNGQNGVYSASSTTLLLVHLIAPAIRSEICGSTRRYDDVVATQELRNGIFSANRRSGTTRHRQLRSSGFAIESDFVDTDAGTMPNGDFYWMARNRTDIASVDQFAATKYGAMWMGLGVSAELDKSFCVALKDLWETASELTLP